MVLDGSPQGQVYYTIYIIIYSEYKDRKKEKINYSFSLQMSLYFKLKILLKLPKLIIVCSKN